MAWLNSLLQRTGSRQTLPEATAPGAVGRNVRPQKRLVAALGDADPQVRSVAAQELGQDADPVHLSLFLTLLEDEHFEVRLAAIRYLRRISDPGIVPALIAHLTDGDSDVRRAAAQALGTARHPTAIEPLIVSLTDEEPAVRHAAAAALEEIDPRWVRTSATQSALPRLEALRQAPKPWIAAAAEKALEKIRAAQDSDTEIWKRDSGIRKL